MELPLNSITVTDIENVYTVASNKGHNVNISDRSSYGLSFCIDGQITYSMNGVDYVSDRNHAIILPKGQSYSISRDKKGAFPLINFQCEGVLCETHTVIPVENPDAFLKDYEQMRQLSLLGGNRLKIMSIFYGILHRLVSRPSPGILTPAIKYIENNYSDPSVDNTVLALQCNISEVYFRKLFVQQYNVTPKQFIIDLRINKAKHLLSEGNLKIAAIAEECGFSNPYHFCRTFKLRTGDTPSSYMLNNKVF